MSLSIERRIARVTTALMGGSFLLPLLGLVVLFDAAGDDGIWRYVLIAILVAYFVCGLLLTRIEHARQHTRVRIWGGALAFHLAFVVGVYVFTDDFGFAIMIAIFEVATVALCAWGLALAYSAPPEGSDT